MNPDILEMRNALLRALGWAPALVSLAAVGGCATSADLDTSGVSDVTPNGDREDQTGMEGASSSTLSSQGNKDGCGDPVIGGEDDVEDHSPNISSAISVDSWTSGDLNDDGSTNILDVVQLVNCVLYPSGCNILNGGDINGDGGANVADITQAVGCLLYPGQCAIQFPWECAGEWGESLELLTSDMVSSWMPIWGEYMVCGDLPASGTECAPWDQINGTNHVNEALGWGGMCFLVDAMANCGPESAVTDACCYTVSVQYSCPVIGRPFGVDGDIRMADLCEESSWCSPMDMDVSGLDEGLRQRLVEEWADAGRGEHASVAAFSRFVLHMMGMGAPADLVSEATRAMGDEIRHARLAFGIASQFAGKDIGVGQLNIDDALGDTDDEAKIVWDAVYEGCVMETIAAMEAAAARDGAQDPTIRKALTEIAEDEARHSALSWRFVRWALETRPHLKDTIEEAFESAMCRPPVPLVIDGDSNTMRQYGRLSDFETHRIGEEVIASVIRPCMKALLAGERSVVGDPLVNVAQS